MKILLICAAGMSTSLLKADMLKNSEPGTVVDAFSYFELEELIDSYDVVLVGPQLSYKFAKIKQFVSNHRKVAGEIDPIAYGRCQGKAVIEQAKKLLKGEEA
jgi:PTS system cellobiose-specific IIB component